MKTIFNYKKIMYIFLIYITFFILLVSNTNSYIVNKAKPKQINREYQTIIQPGGIIKIINIVNKSVFRNITLTYEQYNYILNLHAKEGLGCYQSGYDDCSDDINSFLGIRKSEFKSRPKVVGLTNERNICFKDKGGYFIPPNYTIEQNNKKLNITGEIKIYLK